MLGAGLGPRAAEAFFSGDAGALDAAAVDVLAGNTALTLGALVVTTLVAVVLTHLLPARNRDRR